MEHCALNAALGYARQHSIQTHTPYQLARILRVRDASGEPWTQQEVEERGLPLYWIPGWLQSRLDAGETLSSIAAQYGYNRRTLSTHSKRTGRSLRRLVRFDQAGPWPATVDEVAVRVFDGSIADAAQWLSEQSSMQKLRRVQRGVYDLPPQ